MTAIGTTVYNEVLSTTLRNFLEKKPVNQVWKDHPLFDTVKKLAGSATGKYLVVPVQGGTEASPSFATNGSGLFVPTVSSDIAGSAEYSWSKPLISWVRLRYQDIEENKGATQLQDRLRLHVEDLLEQTRVKIVDLLHTANGSLPSGSFASLDTLFNASVTTVGGINSGDSGNEFWTPVNETSPGTDPYTELRLLFQAVKKNAKGVNPDICHVGANMWNALMEYVQDRGQLNAVGGDGIKLGWQSISVGPVEVRYDYDQPDDRVYLMHSPSLYFKHLNDNFVKQVPAQAVYETTGEATANTLDEVFPVVTIMAVGTSQRRALGMIDGYTG